jgi:type IV secretion system protein VirB6
MFTWAGAQIDGVLATYLTGVLGTVMGWAAAIAGVALTLYILIYGLAVVRGETNEPVKEFTWKMVKLGLIISIATGAGAYQSYVQDIADGLTIGMASAFLPAGPGAPTPATIWDVLDIFNRESSDLVLKAVAKDEGTVFPDLMPYFAAALFSIGNCALLIVAFLVTIFARATQVFVLAIGPLFILCLMWRATARFFDAWLGMLLSTVVLVWVAYFVLGFSVGIGLNFVTRLATSFDTLNLLAEALAYCVLLVSFAFMLYQAPSIAASLSGGGPGQYGAGIIQQAAITYRVLNPGSMTGARNGPPSTAGGGAVTRGTGPAYGVGTAARVGFTNVGALARRAYQRAAMRGRRP